MYEVLKDNKSSKKNADKKAKEWKMRTMQLTIKIF